MLRDEAVCALFDELERQSIGRLHIYVEHGEYSAVLKAGPVLFEGQFKPTLTDALVSLVEVVNGD